MKFPQREFENENKNAYGNKRISNKRENGRKGNITKYASLKSIENK